MKYSGVVKSSKCRAASVFFKYTEIKLSLKRCLIRGREKHLEIEVNRLGLSN